MTDGMLELSDGRWLGYCDWGRRDAPVVFYCHGFPSSRREFEILEPLVDGAGVEVRVIAFDRPGYGLSTPKPNRTLLDWPSDVAEAADQLGVARFAVVGVSGGGPFALACGHRLRARVTSVSVVAGMAPVEASGMRQASGIAGPSRYRPLRRLQFGAAALAFRKGKDARFIDQSISTMCAADQEALGRPQMRDWFARTLGESFEQGGRSAALEAGLFRAPWGFDPAEITVDTCFWHGGADETVPASAGRWLADRVSSSRFHLWPQHGHFTWMATVDAASVFATAAATVGR